MAPCRVKSARVPRGFNRDTRETRDAGQQFLWRMIGPVDTASVFTRLADTEKRFVRQRLRETEKSRKRERERGIQRENEMEEKEGI